MSHLWNRRTFLGSAAGGAAAAFTPYTWTANADEKAVPKSPNDRWRIGVIGLRYQGSVITREALPYGDVVAICEPREEKARKVADEILGKVGR